MLGSLARPPGESSNMQISMHLSELCLRMGLILLQTLLFPMEAEVLITTLSKIRGF